jgi:hypothetical protein
MSVPHPGEFMVCIRCEIGQLMSSVGYAHKWICNECLIGDFNKGIPFEESIRWLDNNNGSSESESEGEQL